PPFPYTTLFRSHHRLSGEHLERFGTLLQQRDDRRQLRPSSQLAAGALDTRSDEAGEIGVRALPEILVVKPAQFLGIELRGRTAYMGEIEPLKELLHRKHFLVAVRPAEPRQIIRQGLGQITVLLVLHDAHRAVALR